MRQIALLALLLAFAAAVYGQENILEKGLEGRSAADVISRRYVTPLRLVALPGELTAGVENPEALLRNFDGQLTTGTPDVCRLSTRDGRSASVPVSYTHLDVYKRQDKDDLFQTDVVTLSGRDDEFMPRFNYKGFRYVEVVADRPVELSAENLTAYAMHSDVAPAGHIETSNDLVDKLWDATNTVSYTHLDVYKRQM